MLTFFYSIFDDRDDNVRQKTIALYAFLIAANVGAWLWAWIVLQNHPFLLASAVLAYTLGLRHAVDADHIAGIDNVSRKLMQEGKRPLTAGLFFSLGHSTIVTLMSVAVGFAAISLQTHFADMKAIGALIGTSVSAFYLFLLALLNLTVLIAVCRTFAAVQRGEALREYDLDLLLNQRGLVARWFRPLFGITTRSWHMYPMGFLFGLGFDTATEVALFGIAAAQAVNGMSLWTIMVFPALFTAGMSLVDTADGTLMQGAYGWAFAKPIRKLYYNITITLISVLVASGIAGIEVLGLLRERYAMTGAFWDGVGALNAHFGLLGYGIIGIFIACWLISFLVYKFKRYDAIEVRLQ